MLYARQVFETYAQKFIGEGDTRIAQQSTGRRTVSPNFVVDDAMVADFREQLKAEHVKIDEAGVRRRTCRFIRAMIRFGIDEAVFGIAEAQRQLIQVDPQAQFALAMFGEAEKLQRARRVDIKARLAEGIGRSTTIDLWRRVCPCPYS